MLPATIRLRYSDNTINEYINLVDAVCNNKLVAYCPCSVIISLRVCVCVTLCAFPPIRLLSAFLTAAYVGDNSHNIKEHFEWSMETMLSQHNQVLGEI